MKWTESEKSAWYPPERLTPSQWAEKHRILPNTVAAESGQLRLDRTPYMREVLDAFADPTIEEIACIKAAQIGWSTGTETLVGYIVDSDPGPILIVLDSETSAKEVMSERILPLIEHTEAVKRHQSPNSHDTTKAGIKFNTCNLYLGWAGSPGSLARRAVRYVFLEEPDKYPANSGKEADPPSLARERTATFGYRRKILIGGTPTTRQGHIWRAWELSGDQRHYHCPCPHCGEYQRLVFGQVKFPAAENVAKLLGTESIGRAEQADAIEKRSLAHYECSSCHQPVYEQHRLRMIARGRWLSKTQTIDREGRISGTRPKAKSVGFCIPALLSPWRTFSAVAAEFLRSQNDPAKLQNFRNSWLAECHEDVVKSSTVDDFRKLVAAAPPPLIVPAWAEYIIAGADVQKDRCYYVVRAWGAGFKSQLLSYGIALDLEELRRHTLETQFPLARGGTSRAHALFIDAGYRTDEIYSFAQTDPRIKAIKGDNDNLQITWKYSSAAKEYGIALYLLNTQLLKDKLSTLRAEGERWLLHKDVSPEYLQHLASEHKIVVKGEERWETRSSGAANHWLDGEVYCLAGAEILRVDTLQPHTETTPIPVTAQPLSTIPQPQSAKPQEVGELDEELWPQPTYLGNTAGWLNR